MKNLNKNIDIDIEDNVTKEQDVAVAPITFILATMAMCVFWMTHP